MRLSKDRSQMIQNDRVGHFICRLAYCRNEELKRWFLKYESFLFHMRLKALTPVQI